MFNSGSQPEPSAAWVHKCCPLGQVLNEWYDCEAVEEEDDFFLLEVLDHFF